jgi:DNA-binding transcriptional MerR regulator
MPYYDITKAQRIYSKEDIDEYLKIIKNHLDNLYISFTYKSGREL